MELVDGISYNLTGVLEAPCIQKRGLIVLRPHQARQCVQKPQTPTCLKVGLAQQLPLQHVVNTLGQGHQFRAQASSEVFGVAVPASLLRSTPRFPPQVSLQPRLLPVGPPIFQSRRDIPQQDLEKDLGLVWFAFPLRRLELVPYLLQLELRGARLVEEDLGKPVDKPSARPGLARPVSLLRAPGPSPAFVLRDGVDHLIRKRTERVHGPNQTPSVSRPTTT
mmetsp:Transcript_9220/g.26207  ORF Transcript_9220/g.26207 Transcript_9220/m.26207 type:complete len:221 (+) Transcript_9220:974-1636(+)